MTGPLLVDARILSIYFPSDFKSWSWLRSVFTSVNFSGLVVTPLFRNSPQTFFASKWCFSFGFPLVGRFGLLHRGYRFVSSQGQRIILEINDPQVALHLLRSCLGVCKINHLLRTVPKSYVEKVLCSFDQGLRSTLTDILKCPVSDAAWKQATLPFRLGGLGLREASFSAAAAFTASVNNSRLIAATVLQEQDPPLFSGPSPLDFPGEESCRSFLLSQLDNSLMLDEVREMSQSSIQVILDNQSLKNLLSTLDICGKARLSTLSSSSDTSCWLRAPPIPSLGLSMPPSSFALACCIWLGIPSFLASPPLLCPCGSTIDPTGDH